MQRILILPDAHHPYVDPIAWKLFLKAGKAFDPHKLVCLGDFIDCHSISAFVRDPDKNLHLKYEIDQANKALTQLDTAFPKASKHMIFGNHEDRVNRFISQEAPELFGLVRLEDLLRFRERGWTHTPYGKHVWFGKLIFTHGDRTNKYHAAAMLDKYGHNVCYGHVHSIQQFLRVTATGEELVAFTPGWLGSLTEAASYIRSFANWAHGFATVYLEDDGLFHHRIHKIIKGRVVLNGKLYTEGVKRNGTRKNRDGSSSSKLLFYPG